MTPLPAPLRAWALRAQDLARDARRAAVRGYHAALGAYRTGRRRRESAASSAQATSPPATSPRSSSSLVAAGSTATPGAVSTGGTRDAATPSVKAAPRGRGFRPLLLDRYVASAFLRLFFLFLFGLPVFISIMDLVEKLDDYTETPPSRVALAYLYDMPTFMLWAFPVAALIATIFTVSNLARHSEVTAAKTGGISFHRMFATLPILGALLTVGALALSELAPVTKRMRAEILGQKSRSRATRTDILYRARDGRVFSIKRLDVENGNIQQVTFDLPGREPDVPSINLFAKEGRYDEESGGWTLYGGYSRSFSGPGRELTFRFDEVRLARFNETPEQLLAEAKDPEEMRYAELGEFIDIAQRSGSRPFKLMVEQAQKISIPIATLIIVLFAAPLASSSPRAGPAYGIGISLGITIVYLMLFKVAGAAGISGAIPPLLAAWLPNLVFAVASAVMIVRVKT